MNSCGLPVKHEESGPPTLGVSTAAGSTLQYCRMRKTIASCQFRCVLTRSLIPLPEHQPARPKVIGVRLDYVFGAGHWPDFSARRLYCNRAKRKPYTRVGRRRNMRVAASRVGRGQKHPSLGRSDVA
jgi:hypothetical protein